MPTAGLGAPSGCKMKEILGSSGTEMKDGMATNSAIAKTGTRAGATNQSMAGITSPVTRTTPGNQVGRTMGMMAGITSPVTRTTPGKIGNQVGRTMGMMAGITSSVTTTTLGGIESKVSRNGRDNGQNEFQHVMPLEPC